MLGVKRALFANREAEKAADAQTRKNLVGQETGGARVSISGVGQLRGGLAFRAQASSRPRHLLSSKAVRQERIRQDPAWRRKEAEEA